MAKKEIIPQAVIEFGKKSGYEENIISFGKWKEYSVYTPYDEDEKESDSGLPQFILYNSSVLRWATPDEIFEIMNND